MNQGNLIDAGEGHGSVMRERTGERGGGERDWGSHYEIPERGSRCLISPRRILIEAESSSMIEEAADGLDAGDVRWRRRAIGADRRQQLQP